MNNALLLPVWLATASLPVPFWPIATRLPDPVWVAVAQSGHWSLLAGQKDKDGGTLDLEGFITEIGADYFVFQGTVKIIGAPDEERLCNVTKAWRFEVTQNRSYYRLREFEWCDGLTDYIDLYFPPALR